MKVRLPIHNDTAFLLENPHFSNESANQANQTGLNNVLEDIAVLETTLNNIKQAYKREADKRKPIGYHPHWSQQRYF